MKHVSLYISDEQHAVIQSLANQHTGGNWSAMQRKINDQFVMPQDYAVHMAWLERLMRAKDAAKDAGMAAKHECGGTCKCRDK